MCLRIEGLCKAYGQRPVLQDFSYTFPQCGVVAIMGPSGQGKTTLLRLIAGLEKPDSGQITLPQNTTLSMVFQEDRLIPSLTVLENILVATNGTEADKQRAHHCLDRLGLGGEGERYPAKLSGGMRRRVAIARAVVHGGTILLMDEPFKGMDEALAHQVMDFVLEQRDRLILFVTHHREEAEQADRIIHLG